MTIKSERPHPTSLGGATDARPQRESDETAILG